MQYSSLVTPDWPANKCKKQRRDFRVAAQNGYSRVRQTAHRKQMQQEQQQQYRKEMQKVGLTQRNAGQQPEDGTR